MSNALTLYRLQQIDSRLDQIQSRLQSIQSALAESAEVKAARERIDQTQADLRTIEQSLKQAENDALAQRIKLDEAEASLYGGSIKNPKELKDLEKDVLSLKRRMQELEDIQLDMMLKAETAREDIQKAQSGYNTLQGQVVMQNAALLSEQETLQKERETVHSRRIATIPAIDTTSLTLYESLREKRSGIAVAAVSNNECEVCGASMTPGHAQSVRTSSQLIHCPMCGRILYSH